MFDLVCLPCYETVNRRLILTPLLRSSYEKVSNYHKLHPEETLRVALKKTKTTHSTFYKARKLILEGAKPPETKAPETKTKASKTKAPKTKASKTNRAKTSLVHAELRSALLTPTVVLPDEQLMVLVFKVRPDQLAHLLRL